VPVKTQRITLSELKIREPKKKELTTEALLRLDAIASAGFCMSRSKMADLIGGDVRVNWKETTQASSQVKTGDLIAISGKGRLQVGEVTVTKRSLPRPANPLYLGNRKSYKSQILAFVLLSFRASQNGFPQIYQGFSWQNRCKLLSIDSHTTGRL